MQTCLASKGPQKPQPQHLSASFPNGYNKHVLATVDSTNAEAARIAGSLSSPTWILGLKQTAGRGRGGRQWADPQGNFAATLVLFPADPLQTRVLRSFVAAVALFDALVTLTGRAEAFYFLQPYSAAATVVHYVMLTRGAPPTRHCGRRRYAGPGQSMGGVPWRVSVLIDDHREAANHPRTQGHACTVYHTAKQHSDRECKRGAH